MDRDELVDAFEYIEHRMGTESLLLEFIKGLSTVELNDMYQHIVRHYPEHNPTNEREYE